MSFYGGILLAIICNVIHKKTVRSHRVNYLFNIWYVGLSDVRTQKGRELSYGIPGHKRGNMDPIRV